jgi:hypothetical protein
MYPAVEITLHLDHVCLLNHRVELRLGTRFGASIQAPTCSLSVPV